MDERTKLLVRFRAANAARNCTAIGGDTTRRITATVFFLMNEDRDFADLELSGEQITELLDAVANELDINIPNLGQHKPQNWSELFAIIESRESRKLKRA